MKLGKLNKYIKVAPYVIAAIFIILFLLERGKRIKTENDLLKTSQLIGDIHVAYNKVKSLSKEDEKIIADIVDSVKIKTRQVTRVEIVEYYYTDTITDTLTLVEQDSGIYPVDYLSKDSCFGFKGKVFVTQQEVDLVIDSKTFRTNPISAYYWEPKTIKIFKKPIGLRIKNFTPFGKEYNKIEVDQCSGELKKRQINIQKK